MNSWQSWKSWWLACSLAVCSAACGGGSSTAPTAPANLVVVGSLSVPGCEALIQLNFGFGIATANCSAFTGVIQNMGTGCASGVHGTTITFGNNQQVGNAAWSYSGTVRPNEQIVYRGGSITVPTIGSFTYTTTPVWTDVPC